MAEQKKNDPAPGTAAPTGAGSRGPTPEQERATVEAASAAPGERRAASRPLAKASESGHPDVHKALADLQTARQNLAAVDEAHGTEDREAKQAETDALDRLRHLGYQE